MTTQPAPKRHSSENWNPELMARLVALETRNQRVEAHKAWETSLTRRIIISLITYAVACMVMRGLDAHIWYFNALIPVGGFLLSTCSLPFVRTLWQRKI